MKRKSFNYLIFILVVFFIGGCATAPKRVSHYPETQLLKSLCEYHQIGWQWDGVAQVVTLSSQNLKARVMVGSNIVMLENESVTLSEPVQRIQNTIIVPPDFERRVIQKLRIKRVQPLRKYKTIILDAGHGGKDPGAIGITGAREKIIVLDITKRVKRILEKSGIKAILTRSQDRFLTLEERTEKASSYNADLFVSIHANSSTSKRPQGVEVYYPKYMGREKGKEDQIKKNQKIFFRKLKMKQSNPAVEKIVFDMLYSHKQNESKDLAWHVSRNLAKSIGFRNRGNMSSGFFVLRNTLVPAVLVEVGYLSNKKEERLLRKPEFRQKVAQAIAQSIIRYEK